MKKILFLFVAFTAIESKAQFSVSNLSVGVSGNYMSFIKIKNSSVGAKADIGYQLNDVVTAHVSYTYTGPFKTASQYVYNNGSFGYRIPTEVTNKISILSIGVDYSIKSNPEGISFYVPITASLILGNNSAKATGASIPAGNELPESYARAEKYKSYMIGAGIGVKYPVGPVQLFADGGIAFPANKVGETEVDVNVSSYLVANVGIRIPFGTPGNE